MELFDFVPYYKINAFLTNQGAFCKEYEVKIQKNALKTSGEKKQHNHKYRMIDSESSLF